MQNEIEMVKINLSRYDDLKERADNFDKINNYLRTILCQEKKSRDYGFNVNSYKIKELSKNEVIKMCDFFNIDYEE